jgi:hypothetical protein
MTTMMTMQGHNNNNSKTAITADVEDDKRWCRQAKLKT